jgi:hypothetical protein
MSTPENASGDPDHKDTEGSQAQGADGAPPDPADGGRAGAEPPPLPEACPPEVAAFLRQVFALGDCLIIRPIEIWTEPGGKRASRTLYRRTIYPRFGTPRPKTWSRLLRTAEEEKANLFFGVCPRVGGKGMYDLAWQVRVVRVLWADLDFCSAEEALARCQTHGVPPPSAVVRSGHGVHLYWFLAEPYRIDDAGVAPPVYKEFLDQGPDKKKKVRRFLIHSPLDVVRYNGMNNPLSLLAFAPLPADDPYLVTAPRAGALAEGLPFDPRPQAPRSLPDRPARPARPAPPRHRPRPGDHAAHRPTLAQRLPGTRHRRLAPQEGQGGPPS